MFPHTIYTATETLILSFCTLFMQFLSFFLKVITFVKHWNLRISTIFSDIATLHIRHDKFAETYQIILYLLVHIFLLID